MMLTLVFSSPVAVQFNTSLSPFRACMVPLLFRYTSKMLLTVDKDDKVKIHKIRYREAGQGGDWRRCAWRPTWSVHKVHVRLVWDAVDDRLAKEEADVLEGGRLDAEALLAVPDDVPRV